MWVDLLVDDLLRRQTGPHVVNDAKTPSGHVTVAHLRGVLLHDCIARTLRDRGVGVEFLYGFDDYDPMDDLPPYLPPEYERYMGMPLAHIPAPEGNAPSYARYYAEEFRRVFEQLGAHPRVYWTSELYTSGRFDEAIRRALDRVEEIREIYRQVTHSQRMALLPEQWASARAGGVVALGTRAAAFAPLPALGAAVVLDAHDEAYHEERAPTWSAWEVVAERARRDGAPCLLVRACPTLDLLEAGRLVAGPREAERAGWPPVEVVDRRGEDPRRGLYSSRLVDLVRWAAGAPGRRVLCVLNRTGRAR